MTIEFEHIANHSSAEVDSIINAMVHTKKESARRFLNVMNSIVDYYISRQSEDDDICFPIIYIPHAPEWAREVWLKFLILKLSLYYNKDNRDVLYKLSNSFNNIVLRTEEDNKRYKKYIAPCRKYVRAVLRGLIDKSIGEEGHKNMIVCSDNDIRVSREDQNKYITEFYGDTDDVFTEKNLIMCHNLDADGVRSQLREHRNEGSIHVDNLFIFYTNNDKINSLEESALERWNTAYHIGLKNCFVFYFSDRPFMLNQICRKGIALCKRFPMITEKDFSQYKHYITFDESETNFMFDRVNTYEHQLFQDDQLMFTDVLGSLLDESEYRIQERNRFSLCLNSELQSLYKRYLKDTFSDFDEESYQLSFDWQLDKAIHEINPYLHKCLLIAGYIRGSQEVGIVIDKNTDTKIKKALTNLLHAYNPNVRVHYYDYSSLKTSKGKANNINENCVIVLQYRPHYTRQTFAKYPNSFDPIPTRKGQHIFDVIQGFIFNDMYEWDKYDYEKALFELMTSTVRKDLFGIYNKPIKPTVRRAIGETEFSDERGNTRSIVYVRGTFDNGQKFSVPESDFVICEIEDETIISRLSDIKREGLLGSIKKLQVLEDIANELKTFIAEKTTQTDERERFIRQSLYSQGKITEQERDSGIALWKILLSKKIEQIGLDEAYNAVMDGLKKNERIMINQFKHWADYNNDMILPLQKVCQRKLFDYLGFGLTSPYLSIMRSKKLSTINGTRRFNSITTSFLLQTLLVEINDELFEGIRDSEINDLLLLRNSDDLDSLIYLLKEKIYLRNVITIA